MNKQFKILKNHQGFTLIEMLVNILIISSVTVSMFFTFNKINEHTAYESIKQEAAYYSTNVLDMIAHEMRRSQEVSYRTILSRTKIQCTIPVIKDTTHQNKKNFIPEIEWEDSQIIVDLNSGVSCTHCTKFKNRESSFLDFNPKDEAGRTKYKLSKFKIEDVEVNLGDIFSDQAYDAREASRQLYLEVLLYRYYNQLIPSDTLRFTRRIFLPGLLVEPTEENS